MSITDDSIEEPQAGQVWRHVRKGSLYWIVTAAGRIEATWEPAVGYVPFETGRLCRVPWITPAGVKGTSLALILAPEQEIIMRSLSEFTDGRFVKLEDGTHVVHVGEVTNP